MVTLTLYDFLMCDFIVAGIMVSWCSYGKFVFESSLQHSCSCFLFLYTSFIVLNVHFFQLKSKSTGLIEDEQQTVFFMWTECLRWSASSRSGGPTHDAPVGVESGYWRGRVL